MVDTNRRPGDPGGERMGSPTTNSGLLEMLFREPGVCAPR